MSARPPGSARPTGRRSAYAGRWPALVALAVASAAASPALAHHTSTTSRVSGGAAQRGSSQLSALPPAPRLSLGLGLESSYFGSARAGSDSYDKLPLGSVWLERVAVRGELELESSTKFGLRLPAGLVIVQPPDEPSRSSAGLGDVELSLGQELLSWLGVPSSAPLALSLSVGLLAPSGAYEPENGLTLTDVSGAPDGSIGVNIYNTRASLGGGAWAGLSGLALDWRFTNRAAMQLELSLALPLSHTPDDILWGSDELLRGGVSFEVVEERLSLLGGLDYRRHATDTLSAGAETERVGGRRELGAELGAQLALRRNISCSLAAHLPLWRQVNGVQLVETFSASTSCGWAVGL